jgi:peptide subunit release factor 1 (eRF1)
MTPGAIQLVEESLSQKELYNLIVIADRNKHSDIANFALKLLSRAFDPLFIVTEKKETPQANLHCPACNWLASNRKDWEEHLQTREHTENVRTYFPKSLRVE